MKITIVNACSIEDACYEKLQNVIRLVDEEKHHTVESFNLFDLTIKQCLGCNSCSFKTPGTCIHKDDVVDILKSIVHSDRTILIYSLRKGFMNSLMKKLIDRFYLFELPYIIIENNAMSHKLRYEKFPDIGFIIQSEADTTPQELSIARQLNAHLPQYYKSQLLFDVDAYIEAKELIDEITSA